MPRLRIVILASGSGSLAQAVFDSKLDIEILKVISDKQSLVLERAVSAGIANQYLPIGANRDIWEQELINEVEKLNPDLVVSLGFMRILPKAFIDKFRTINTHPALLPNFPGAHAVRDALLAKVEETGTSIHWVDEGVDTGPVIGRVAVPINAGDTEASLQERIKIVERRLIVETLQSFIDNGIPEFK